MIVQDDFHVARKWHSACSVPYYASRGHATEQAGQHGRQSEPRTCPEVCKVALRSGGVEYTLEPNHCIFQLIGREAGVVRLTKDGQAQREVGGVLPGIFDADQTLPDLEGDIARSTMLGGSQAVVAELEMVVDPAVGGEEALRVSG